MYISISYPDYIIVEIPEKKYFTKPSYSYEEKNFSLIEILKFYVSDAERVLRKSKLKKILANYITIAWFYYSARVAFISWLNIACDNNPLQK